MKKFALLFVSALLVLTSCIKDQYDKPEPTTDPDIESNYTIKQLKDAYKASGLELMTIEEDFILKTVVTADDRTGNFYKELVVQDESAAIGIQINRTNLYNDFPIGKRVFINLKGLVVGNDENLIQIGGYIDSVSVSGARQLGYINTTNVTKHLIGGSTGHTVEPEVVTINGLDESHQYKLIKLEKMEFVCADMGNTYADIANLNTGERYLKNCTDDEIEVRTSGYATFAGSPIPSKNGDVVGIYTVYRSDNQLLIRDTADLDLVNERCKACPGGTTGTETLISIKDLRDMYTGNNVAVSDKKVKGVVISDITGGNITDRNLVIQDETGGITLRFTNPHTYKVNDEVEVAINGLTLEEYRTLLQLNNVTANSVKKIGTSTPSPRVTTIADLRNNIDDWESTLVKISQVEISGAGSTYSGTKSVADAVANIDLYTAFGATFASTEYKQGKVDITAILGKFNGTPQLTLRTENDVEGGSTPTYDPTSIGDIRALFSGTATSVSGKSITGTVISDKDNGNMVSQNLVIQDNTGGIVVRFTENHNFAVGDKVTVKLGGVSLETYNGLLQLNNVTLVSAELNGTGTVTPQTVTIKQINDNFDQYESELVVVSGCTISGGGTSYSDANKFTDATGDIVTFVRNTSSFSGDAFPTNTVTITGIVSKFNSNQLLIRSKNDVQ